MECAASGNQTLLNVASFLEAFLSALLYPAFWVLLGHTFVGWELVSLSITCVFSFMISCLILPCYTRHVSAGLNNKILHEVFSCDPHGIRISLFGIVTIFFLLQISF